MLYLGFRLGSSLMPSTPQEVRTDRSANFVRSAGSFKWGLVSISDSLFIIANYTTMAYIIHQKRILISSVTVLTACFYY